MSTVLICLLLGEYQIKPDSVTVFLLLSSERLLLDRPLLQRDTHTHTQQTGFSNPAGAVQIDAHMSIFEWCAVLQTAAGLLPTAGTFRRRYIKVMSTSQNLNRANGNASDRQVTVAGSQLFIARSCV